MFAQRTVLLLLLGAILNADDYAADAFGNFYGRLPDADSASDSDSLTDRPVPLKPTEAETFFQYYDYDECAYSDDEDDCDEDRELEGFEDRELEFYEGWQRCSSFKWQTSKYQALLPGMQLSTPEGTTKQLQFMCVTCEATSDYQEMLSYELTGKEINGLFEVVSDQLITVHVVEEARFVSVDTSVDTPISVLEDEGDETRRRTGRQRHGRRARGGGRGGGLRHLESDEDTDQIYYDQVNGRRIPKVDFCVSAKRVKVFQFETEDERDEFDVFYGDNACDTDYTCINFGDNTVNDEDDKKCQCDEDRTLERRRKLLTAPSRAARRRERRKRQRQRRAQTENEK